MAISRAQMEEQIKGFEDGGDVDIFSTDLSFQPPSQKSIDQYESLLTALSQREKRPTTDRIYDLASTVGASILAADPTAGAFRSLGMGLAEYSKGEAQRRRAAKEEDRAIALKAFELAKSDADRATQLLNEYARSRAKKIDSAKYKQYVVKNPNGITVRDVKYPAGQTVFLNELELPTYLQDVEIQKEGEVFTPENEFGYATFLSPEEAEKKFNLFAPGLKESNPEEFKRILDLYSTSDEKLIGRGISVNSSYGDFTVFRNEKGDPVSIGVTPNKDYGKTPIASYREEYEKSLAQEDANLRRMRSSIIPDLNAALALLLDGKAETGPFKGRVATLRMILSDAFGVDVEGMSDLEVIISIANRNAPTMRVAGSGSTSDTEFKAMLSGLLSAEKTPKSNYLSAYMLVQRHRIQEEQLRVLQEMLYDPNVTSPTEITEAVNSVNTSLFEKYTGDPEDQQAIADFYNNLPRGAVIKNDPFNPIFVDPKTGKAITDVYIIKGADF